MQITQYFDIEIAILKISAPSAQFNFHIEIVYDFLSFRVSRAFKIRKIKIVVLFVKIFDN